jgi:drug/metabolite transporter (DMT)-like permease
MNKSNVLKMTVLVFLCILWGTTWIAIKYSLEGIPPFLGAMFRFAVALTFLYFYARMKGLSLRLKKHHFKYIFISGVLLYLFDYGLIYWGEQYLYAGVTAVFFATFPLFTGLVSNFVYKNESFQWSKFLGLLLAFCGITLIFYDQLLVTEFSGLVFWASLAIIFSALSAAFSLVMVKKYLSEVPTVALTLHQMVWGIIILGIIGLLRGEAANIHLTTRVVASVFYLGAIGSALAFVLFYSLLKEMSAITLSSIIYVTPLVAILVGWILLDETITLRILAGTFIIFGGIALSQIKDYKKALRSKELEAIPVEKK